jgi:hypothetical protein
VRIQVALAKIVATTWSSTWTDSSWDLDPTHWVTAACRMAGRNLTEEEWSIYISDLAPYHETCPGFA